MARPHKILSARKVQTLISSGKRGFYADGDRLFLRIDGSGAWRWAFVYHRQGKRREMGLGRMELKDAREAASEARRQIRGQTDPIEARRTSRKATAGIPSFKAISSEVIADAQAKSTNGKVRYQWELLLGPRYCGFLLDKPLTDITTLDIERILRPVWTTKPETGRKLLAKLRRVFDFGRIHLRDRHGIIMQANPALWQDLRHRGFERNSKPSRGRQAALDYRQVTEFRVALRQRQVISARALEVTLLTGLRTGEVIGARWNEIDLERQIWIIPIERLKDRRTRTEHHRVPLSSQVMEILKNLPRQGEFVFPGAKQDKPLSNMAMLGLLKDLNRDGSGEYIWVDPKNGRRITPHGLRATFRTWGEEAGLARELLEESLGHQVGTAVERVYRRTDNFARRRNIMQAWADFCYDNPASNVIPLVAVG